MKVKHDFRQMDTSDIIKRIKAKVDEMTMQIIFIRHGIAENCSDDQSDFSRRLTAKGRERLERTLPQLRPFISDKNEVQIWSSPLVRARETSEIAADIFHVKDISVRDFISEGYFNGFREAVETLDPAIDRTIIVVGHEPFMSNWSQALCGASLPFKKGAAAGFSYQKDEPDTSELQWFFQPELMEILSSKNSSSEILPEIRNILLSHAKKVLQEHTNFLENPSDPEAAHQLRVSIRKLRSLLVFIKPLQKDKQNTSMQESLKKVIAEVSYLRELDVLREACEAFFPEKPQSGEADSVISALLKKERKDEADRVIAAVSGSETADLLHKLEADAEDPEWKKNIDKNESIIARLEDRFAEMYHVFELAAASVDYSDEAASHSLRIDAKKLRYIISSLEPLTNHSFGIIGAELKTAHEVLGQLCDARRNKDILKKFDSQNIPDTVHSRLHEIIDSQDRIIEGRLFTLKRRTI